MPKPGAFATKVEAMHKAGFPPWASLVVLLVSSPGFYEFFVNDQDAVAEAKAEVGYEITRQSIEALRRENAEMKEHIRSNQAKLFQLAMTGNHMSPALGPPFFDVHASAPEAPLPKLTVPKKPRRRAAAVKPPDLLDSFEDDLENLESFDEMLEVPAALPPTLDKPPPPPPPQQQQQAMPADLDGPVRKWLKKKSVK